MRRVDTRASGMDDVAMMCARAEGYRRHSCMSACSRRRISRHIARTRIAGVVYAVCSAVFTAGAASAASPSLWDFTGNGVLDFMVPLPVVADQQPIVGEVRIYDGHTRSLAYSLQSHEVNDLFGVAIGPAGDVDGDGLRDIMVGAPGSDLDGLNRGRV